MKSTPTLNLNFPTKNGIIDNLIFWTKIEILHQCGRPDLCLLHSLLSIFDGSHQLSQAAKLTRSFVDWWLRLNRSFFDGSSTTTITKQKISSFKHSSNLHQDTGCAFDLRRASTLKKGHQRINLFGSTGGNLHVQLKKMTQWLIIIKKSHCSKNIFLAQLHLRWFSSVKRSKSQQYSVILSKTHWSRQCSGILSKTHWFSAILSNS